MLTGTLNLKISIILSDNIIAELMQKIIDKEPDDRKWQNKKITVNRLFSVLSIRLESCIMYYLNSTYYLNNISIAYGH